ncbi:hypothetical protein PPL_06780 [Heterostelium album PN500]|uniref:Uncharacterized protein n=1 Tax=Heterostelium pallidum (strain ATCC 26659 / Pp 5 / PN500) TaxID=670386 RepID=D3BFP5_HETP5|nr:hypothetical protein PPL_06780 [Heterostelium album PN500]EFA79959.1 hypothetical protein PPL_06780 [Heterostelium album PN500]|eukprot:XP_020432079.1 hypothetical protein PPL_06780 [Heterostelium album PN500]
MSTDNNNNNHSSFAQKRLPESYGSGRSKKRFRLFGNLEDLDIETVKTMQSTQAILNYKDRNSLSNLIKIYDQYFKCDQHSTESRITCVKFFVQYHTAYKFAHYFDVKGYAKFIAEVFFEQTTEVFKEIVNLVPVTRTSVIKDIYQRVVNDIRLNVWFRKWNESDVSGLKERIANFSYCLEYDRFEPIGIFTYDYLYDIIYNGNVLAKQMLIVEKRSYRGEDNDDDDDEISIQKEDVEESLTNNIKLSELLLEKIISFSLLYDKNRDFHNKRRRFRFYRNHFPYFVDKDQIITVAKVSKQFFKIISKMIVNKHFNWRGDLELNNNNNYRYNLVRSPPLYFDYESIKYIPYDKGIEYANHMMSRVEVFTIESDESDHSALDSTSRSLQDFRYEDYEEEELDRAYRKAIIRNGYLVYPPAMPNLKDIIVFRYFGYEDCYSRLLSHIIMSTPNGDGHGIERLAIDIVKDVEGTLSANIEFLRPLLMIHSKTLKSIKLSYRDDFQREEYDQLEWTSYILTLFVQSIHCLFDQRKKTIRKGSYEAGFDVTFVGKPIVSLFIQQQNEILKSVHNISKPSGYKLRKAASYSIDDEDDEKRVCTFGMGSVLFGCFDSYANHNVSR